jgi:uncharacterized repeat protein (TIGR01451 family)
MKRHAEQDTCSGDRGPRTFLRVFALLAAVLMAFALAPAAPALAKPAPAAPQHTPPPGGGTVPVPPGVVNNCTGNTIFYFFRYNDSATVGVDKGCSASINVYKTDVPSLVATYLHVSCSDNISPEGVPTKSILGDPNRRVAAYFIQKPDGKTCGFGNPAGPPKVDVSIVKTASQTTVTAGATITYTLKVSNLSTTTAHGVTATDVLPSGVQFVSASTGCSYDSGSRTVTCTADTLGGTSTTPTSTCTGSKDIYYKWEYNDSATVGIDEGCSQSIDVYKTQVPSLVATYLHVSCSDKISSDGVPTKSKLGDPNRRVKAYYILKPDGKTCGQGTFSPPPPVSFTIKVTVSSSHCNTATVTSTEADSDTSNNSSQVCITVTPPPMGYVEICKSTANGVSGTFTFTVNGGTYSVPAGACTAAIQVPAGNVTVHEAGRADYAMDSASTLPSNRLVSVDTGGRNIVVKVVSGDKSTQTIVNVVNRPVTGTVKVCEIAGSGVTVGTVFDFTNSATGQVAHVPAGPASQGGYCVVLDGSFTHNVTVTQAPDGSTQVTAIVVDPSDRFVSKNLAQRTGTLLAGLGVTEVTFTNARIS